MNRSEVIAKLNKLKAFLERDCGVESENARRIATRLIAEHKITKEEFSYFWHADEDAQRAKREAEDKDAKARKDFADFMSKMHRATSEAKERREARERAQTAHREREQRRSAEENARRKSNDLYTRLSYSSFMRKALLDLLRNMGIRHRVSGAKVEASFVSHDEKVNFDARWNDVKSTIQRRLDEVLRETCEEILRNQR